MVEEEQGAGSGFALADPVSLFAAQHADRLVREGGQQRLRRPDQAHPPCFIQSSDCWGPGGGAIDHVERGRRERLAGDTAHRQGVNRLAKASRFSEIVLVDDRGRRRKAGRHKPATQILRRPEKLTWDGLQPARQRRREVEGGVTRAKPESVSVFRRLGLFRDRYRHGGDDQLCCVDEKTGLTGYAQKLKRW